MQYGVRSSRREGVTGRGGCRIASVPFLAMSFQSRCECDGAGHGGWRGKEEGEGNGPKGRWEGRHWLDGTAKCREGASSCQVTAQVVKTQERRELSRPLLRFRNSECACDSDMVTSDDDWWIADGKD